MSWSPKQTRSKKQKEKDSVTQKSFKRILDEKLKAQEIDGVPLTQKDAQYRKELNDIRVRYQAKVKEYQEKGPTLSQNQQSEYEQLLMKLQNDYSVKEQENSNAMQSHMADRLPPVKMKIQEYLKRFSSNRGYAYVFASNKDDDIFYYKDSIRNITDSIIIGLNKEYEDSRKK